MNGNMMYKTMRPKRSVVRDEFMILPEGAKCKHCHRFVRCVQSSNMKKHLRYCQPEIYKMVQEADGSFTYNNYPSPLTMSVMSPSMNNQQHQHQMKQQPQYSRNGSSNHEHGYPKSEGSVSFTSDHISSFIESQLANFKYNEQMEEDGVDGQEDDEPSSSPDEIPGSNNEKFLHDLQYDDDNDKSMMDAKALKAFSSFDTIEINDGQKSYECLMTQVDPFLISKYFGIPVLALRLRSTTSFIVSRVTPDLKRFIPSLAAGQKYELISDEEANKKISKCRIIIDQKNYEIKCFDCSKEMIMGYMESPVEDSFVLIDEEGNVIDDAENDTIKLEDEKVYHVIYGQSNLLNPLEKTFPMPIEFPAGIPINRSMSLLPPYLICISRAMHILTFIGEKFDLRTSTPSPLIGHTVANHAAQVLCRLNDASKKIQFVTSKISNNILTSSLPTNSFTAVFCKNETIQNGDNGRIKLPTTDIDQIVGSLERALSDMENFLQRLKSKFQVEISIIQHIEMALKIDNGCRERKERIEEFKSTYGDTDKLNEYKQVAETGTQICPDKSQLNLSKVSESRKHFTFISKLMEKLLQSQKMGKFSFNDLAELLIFSTEVLHYIYLHWLFIKKFAYLSHQDLESDIAETLLQQFKNCSSYWYTVSQNVSLPTAIIQIFNISNLWKAYYESIIKAQYTVESLFFAGSSNFEE